MITILNIHLSKVQIYYLLDKKNLQFSDKEIMKEYYYYYTIYNCVACNNINNNIPKLLNYNSDLSPDTYLNVQFQFTSWKSLSVPGVCQHTFPPQHNNIDTRYLRFN